MDKIEQTIRYEIIYKMWKTNAISYKYRVSLKKNDPLFLTYIMFNFGNRDDKTKVPPEFYVHEVKKTYLEDSWKMRYYTVIWGFG